MIKKFHEYSILENQVERYIYGVFSIIPEEDIEDQFLRLKEVYNCDIQIRKDIYKAKYVWFIRIRPFNESEHQASDLSHIHYRAIYDEIYSIKRRIEAIYPLCEVVLTPSIQSIISPNRPKDWVGCLVYIRLIK